MSEKARRRRRKERRLPPHEPRESADRPVDELLRQTEQRFRTILDHTSDGIFLLDLDARRFTICNQSCLRMLGYTPEEFAQLRIEDLHPPEDLPFILAQIEEFLQGRKGIRHDIRFRRKDGSILVADLSPEMVQLDGKRYIVVALKDITERRRMEEELRQDVEHLEEQVDARTRALQESEARYRSLAENAPDVIQRFDRNLRHLYVNPAFERATGLSPAAVIGKTDRELGLPEDLIPLWEQAAQVVLRTGKSQNIVFEMPTPHGPRHYEARLVPEFAPDGSTEHVLAITRDVTERTHAEEALRFTQFAIDHTADAAFWMTEDARFFYVNEAACQALGYSCDELMQMTVYDIDPAFTESMWRANWRRLKAEKSLVFETVHRARDGRVYPVEIRANYLEFGGREYDCAFARDITERKQAEEALRRLNEQLELQVARRTEDLRHTVDRLRQSTLELSQAEDRECRRIADILHDDVQQTLAAAKFHLNLLGREPHSAAESQKIIEQARQMLGDAIEKSRSLSHELSPALYQVDLMALLEGLAQHMQQKHGLLVHVAVHDPGNASPEPVRALLYKVARELLFNVVKHAGVREARLRVRRRGPCLYLSVADRGRGFDPEKLEAAAGFGLLNIRERVQMLGGRMKIRSRPGRGSRFLIVIPDQAASPEVTPADCSS